MVKKISRGLLALCLSVFMTGCGSNKVEVADYGNIEETSDASTLTEEQLSEETEDTTVKEPVDMSADEDGSLVDKLGGAEHYWESTFTASGISVDVKINVEVKDTEELPSYKISTIEESEINESEIVKNLLGDSAKKIERELSIAEGDSETVIQGINGLYLQYNSVSGDDLKLPEEVMTASTAPGWQDEEEYFIHTYEGMSDGVEYELFLGYDKKEKAEYVAYFPKNPGEVLGNPDLDYMTEYWMETGLASVPDVKELIGEEPERNYDAILSEADSEIRTDLGLKTPEGSIQKDEYENEKEYIIFLSKSKLQQNGHESLRDLENIYDLKEVLENMGPNSYEFNGFEASYGASLANQDFFFDMSQGINGIHQGGIVYFTDEAILGYNLTIDKEFDDVLSYNVPVLNYDNVISAFEEAVTDNLDVTQCPESSLCFEYARIAYYPVHSPENPDETTYIPAWEFITTNAGTVVLLNAMDGSLLDIIYDY